MQLEGNSNLVKLTLSATLVEGDSKLLFSVATTPRCRRGRLSQPVFDPSFGNLARLATLMSSDRTKQICPWMIIHTHTHTHTHIYIYIYYKQKFMN